MLDLSPFGSLASIANQETQLLCTQADNLYDFWMIFDITNWHTYVKKMVGKFVSFIKQN